MNFFRLSQVLLLSATLSSPLFAHVNEYSCNECRVRPFIILGGGAAVTSKLGTSQIFLDPTGGVDTYSPSSGIHTGGAIDSFFGVEFLLHPAWALQLGLGYNQTTALNATGTWVQNANTPFAESFDYHYKVIPRQYFVAAKVLVNCWGYYPYILAAAGISQNDAYSYTETSGLTTFARETTSAFTYMGGVGLDIDVIRNVRLGLGYRFSNFGKVRLGKQVIDSIPVIGTLSQSNFYVHEGLVEITFLFY